jgi:4-amino-4-deoxy-L-arabinose transferase-like glycosyltransferase
VWILLLPSALAVAVYLRAWPEAPVTAPDSSGYLKTAGNVFAHGEPLPPYRTPGYPILLRVVGDEAGPTRLLFVVQLLLQIATVYLACAALRSAGAGAALTVAVGLLGLLPPYVYRSAYVLTENLAQFCVVLAVACLQCFLVRGGWGWLALSSLGLGYAALTRPTFLLAAVALGVLLLLLRAATKTFSFEPRQALLLVAGTALLVGSYAAVIETEFGVTGTTGTLGRNLADLCPNLYEEIPDPTMRRLFVEARNDAYVHGRAVEWAHYKAYDQLMLERHLKPEELEPFMRAQLTRVVLGHPVQYLQAVSASVTRFVFPSTANLPLMRETRYQLLWFAIHFLVLGTLLAETFVFGAWCLLAASGTKFNEAINRAWVLWFASMAVVLYNAAVSCAIEIGEVRFRNAAEMLLLLAAGAGIVGSRRLFRTLPLLKVSPRVSSAARGHGDMPSPDTG